MAPASGEVRDVLQLLRVTPTLFKRTAAGWSDEELARGPAPGAWSLNEVLAHLRGAADVQGRWIERMLAEDGTTIRYASPRTGMRKGGYAALAFGASLRAFTQQRAALVKTLASLSPDDWKRHAVFTGTTPGWTQTVLDVARGIGGHERSHQEQIRSAVTDGS
jgi:hypothetical protein